MVFPISEGSWILHTYTFGRWQGMKVYIRSYRIPTVLIIMGGIMAIVASTTMAVDKYAIFLFIYGTVCLLLGIFGWLGVQIPKALKSLFKPRRSSDPAMTNKRR